ncbi:hypothetical protein [Synechococcus sp. LA31]|uniref:hypothetical protein n=1 Tax=Synechococcus sp. LA31 TaxID=2741953 RepID=UPI001BDC2827|nr:hypothetical protein [Synechococcus sp. LA31]QVV66756.1 hypothetical protein KJJ24_09690 [Synechococcus sp. LA31]
MERFDRFMDWAFPILRKASQVVLACAVSWWSLYGLHLLSHAAPWTLVALPVLALFAFVPRWR